MSKIEISKEVKEAIEGLVPATIATYSSTGIPNVTFISRLFLIDNEHVAISYQFMNKTWRNILENPSITVFVTYVETMAMYKLKLEFKEELKEGDIFEEMEMQLMALSSPEGINFTLYSALICRIIEIEPVFEGASY